MEKLDSANARVHEARIQAEQAGRDAATETTRMRSNAEHEIRTVRQNLEQLSMENRELQQRLTAALRNRTSTTGIRVRMIGGVYEGEMGTLVRCTPERRGVIVDGDDTRTIRLLHISSVEYV